MGTGRGEGREGGVEDEVRKHLGPSDKMNPTGRQGGWLHEGEWSTEKKGGRGPLRHFSITSLQIGDCRQPDRVMP